MSFLHWIFRVLLLLSLTACTHGHLSVQTDYINRDYLASDYVETPDPSRYCPPVGQRLIIEWFFPRSYLAYQDLHLELTVRLRNKHEKRINIPALKSYGVFIYALVNADFIDSGGIQTYKVDVVGNGQVLKEWRHQLWTDLITFDIPNDKESNAD